MTGPFHPRGKECQCVRCGIVFTAESAYVLHERMPPAVCITPEALVSPSGERLMVAVERRGVVMWRRRSRSGWRGPQSSEGPHRSSEIDETTPDA